MFEQLTALSGKLGLTRRRQEVDWKSGQLDVLREQLPQLAELAVATPLAKLVAAAQRDLEVQSGPQRAASPSWPRNSAAARSRTFRPRDLAAKRLSLAELKDQVTVLHFWDYRDEPLKEPYGQVGYLDFIYHRRKPSRSASLRRGGRRAAGRRQDPRRGRAQRARSSRSS